MTILEPEPDPHRHIERADTVAWALCITYGALLGAVIFDWTVSG